MPKGVVQNHRNTLCEIRRHTNAFRICANDRLSFLLSSGVIGGVREILSTLLNGAALYPFDLREKGLADLANWLVREGITICRLVSTVFRHFMDTLTHGEQFPDLRLVHVGGEPVYRREVE